MHSLVSLDQMALAPLVDGSCGRNRAPSGSQLSATDDRSAVLAWLARYADSPATLASYRKEAERLMLWCTLQHGVALSDLAHEDLLIYQRFLTDPQPAERWVMEPGQKPARDSIRWRPFAGPLGPSSQRQAMSILNAMFSWLVEAGYLAGNPLSLSRRKRKLAPPRVSRFLPMDHWDVVKATIQAMPVSTDRERLQAARSILTDIDRSRVLDLVPERKLVAAVSLLETLTPAQRTSVKAVAMDMWPAYMSAARQCMPQADIVHDKFHVSKYLGEAVDAVRKQEHRKLSQAGTSPLKGSKWAWLKSYPDGRSAEAVSFRALNQLNLKTSRAWCIKENFSQFWTYSYKGAAKRFFKAWSNNAMRSRLEPVKKVVKMLRRHEEGLLNYSQHGISNACAEGFNSAIQLIKANARGFRNFTNYRARILFHCGKLNLAMA